MRRAPSTSWQVAPKERERKTVNLARNFRSMMRRIAFDPDRRAAAFNERRALRRTFQLCSSDGDLLIPAEFASILIHPLPRNRDRVFAYSDARDFSDESRTDVVLGPGLNLSARISPLLAHVISLSAAIADLSLRSSN